MPLDWRTIFPFPITTDYGAPAATTGAPHYAIDFATPKDFPIVLPFSGIVTREFEDSLGGRQLEVKEPQTGTRFLFAHLDRFNVGVGDKFNAGSIVALTGDSGTVTGPHVHLEERNPQGQLVNPLTNPLPSGVEVTDEIRKKIKDFIESEWFAGLAIINPQLALQKLQEAFPNVDKATLRDVLNQEGKKSLADLWKDVPVAGGVIGGVSGGVDAITNIPQWLEQQRQNFFGSLPKYVVSGFAVLIIFVGIFRIVTTSVATPTVTVGKGKQ